MIGDEEEIVRLRAENIRLKNAGDRILSLISRVSDQATDEQRAEALREEYAMRRIWVDAKYPPVTREDDA